MQPAVRFPTSPPPWKATPDLVKNTEYGIAEGWPAESVVSELRWLRSLDSTWNVPVGVSSPGPPVEASTGPRATRPSSINHALPLKPRSPSATHATMSMWHGVPGTSEELRRAWAGLAWAGVEPT